MYGEPENDDEYAPVASVCWLGKNLAYTTRLKFARPALSNGKSIWTPPPSKPETYDPHLWVIAASEKRSYRARSAPDPTSKRLVPSLADPVSMLTQARPTEFAGPPVQVILTADVVLNELPWRTSMSPKATFGIDTVQAGKARAGQTESGTATMASSVGRTTASRFDP